jgi:hypothetical protein
MYHRFRFRYQAEQFMRDTPSAKIVASQYITNQPDFYIVFVPIQQEVNNE